MYRPKAFAVDELARVHGFIRRRVFASLCAVIDGAPQLAYAPIVLDETFDPLGAVRFHLARSNPVASVADGHPIVVSLIGEDAYVSPDWYETRGMVPTWNYIAVEGRGFVRRLDKSDLRQLLVDLSAMAEAKLSPKPLWTIDNVADAKLAALMDAIDGFEVVFSSLEGKFKLSQNLKPEDIMGARRGLLARGDAASNEIARLMQESKS